MRHSEVQHKYHAIPRRNSEGCLMEHSFSPAWPSAQPRPPDDEHFARAVAHLHLLDRAENKLIVLTNQETVNIFFKLTLCEQVV